MAGGTTLVTPDEAFLELHLAPGASWDQVVRASRSLAKDVHPDIDRGGGPRMQRVNEARDVLSKHYGRTLDQGPSAIEETARRQAAERAADAAEARLQTVRADLFEARRLLESVRTRVAREERNLSELQHDLNTAEEELEAAQRGAEEAQAFAADDEPRGWRPKRTVVVCGFLLIAGAVGTYALVAERAHRPPADVGAVIDGSWVEVAWEDDTIGESGYEVRAIGFDGDYYLNSPAGASAASWPVPPPGETYCFEVRPYRDNDARPARWSEVLGPPGVEDWIPPWSEAWVPPWPETWTSPWPAYNAGACVSSPQSALDQPGD